MKKLLPLLLDRRHRRRRVLLRLSEPPTALVLTGVVTTNDIVVGPQIGGRIDDLRVQEGDTVKQGQIIAIISPDELRAESAYAVHNVEGIASQIQQSQAALRFEEQQMNEQVRQAESNLARRPRRSRRPRPPNSRRRASTSNGRRALAREGVAPAQQLDTARTSLRRGRRAPGLAEASGRRAPCRDRAREDQRRAGRGASRGQVVTNQHLQEAAPRSRQKPTCAWATRR